MSIPGNGANRCNYGCVHYRPSGYPVSTGSVQPADQQWDNFSPPPAYETIDRLPIWNEENLHLSTPRTTEIWIRRSETNVPSMSQELHTPSNFQQTSSLQFNTPSTFPELSGLYALSQPNSYTVEPQTIDFKQQFRRFRPRVLGIVLIILSILEISLGISLAVSLYKHDLKSLLFGTLFWVPGIQMFAGTMLIVSWAKTSICSVKCVLCISFLSFIASVIGLIFNSCDLNDMLCISHFHPIVCRIIFEKDFNIYCCLIALNILALLLSFFASCIGNMTLGLKTSREINDVMSIQINEITMQNQDFVHYPPPQYDEIPAIVMGNVNAVPPTQHLLTECNQPPAYDTLSDLPIWVIPLPDSDMSFIVDHWITNPQIPLHSVTSSPQYQRSNAVTSQTSETPLFYYKFWKSPPAIVGYLLTGCLSIIVHFKPLRVQIRNSLIFNILTTIISPVGLVFNVIDLETLWNYQYPQNSIGEYKFYYTLISTNVALLCLSISANIFGLYALCHSSTKDPQESEIENGFMSPTPPSELLQSQLPSPPPYTPQEITIQ